MQYLFKYSCSFNLPTLKSYNYNYYHKRTVELKFIFGILTIPFKRTSL